MACFIHSSAQMCLYQTPGRRPPPINGHFANTVTRGWIGASNERAPFRFHGAVVGFVDRCLYRTRHPAASNKHLSELFSGRRPILGPWASGRSWPKIGPGIGFLGFSKSLKKKKNRRFVLIASGTEIFWSVSICEILSFYGNISLKFLLSPVDSIISHFPGKLSLPCILLVFLLLGVCAVVYLCSI